MVFAHTPKRPLMLNPWGLFWGAFLVAFAGLNQQYLV